MSNPKTLAILPIGRRDGEDVAAPYPVDGWGLKMAIGSEIVGVATHRENLAVLVLFTPNALQVWHPLLVFPIGGSFAPMLGRKIGKCFGGVGNWMVFEDSPWPTSALEGLSPVGAA